ncbi:MAG TPA: hypothetical protein VGM54_08805 [Chthoniobacter sp.]|jgi:hypothetical protein
MKKYFPLIFCFCVIASLGAGAFTLAWSDSNSQPKYSAPPSASSPSDNHPKLLRIAGTVDGSGRIVFTQDSVHYEHKYWAGPTDMTFDGKSWENLSETPAGWQRIAAQYDLSKAHIIERDGRDVIALELTSSGFDLYLCDSPEGADHYEVVIAIPSRS